MSRPYAIHSSAECERLERQAALAQIESHLRHLPLPETGRILDAGSDLGSMARTLARAAPGCNVIGADLRADYIASAQAREGEEALANVTFEVADVRRLPWPDGYFDLMWSRYMLQWLDRPKLAVAEFRRVLKPGVVVVCSTFDGFGVAYDPPDPGLEQRAERVFAGLVDPFAGRKMATMFLNAGLVNVAVDIEPDHLFTVIGAIEPDRRRNWEESLAAARPHIAGILGGDSAATDFIQDFLQFQDKPGTCSYTGLFFARGTQPVS